MDSKARRFGWPHALTAVVTLAVLAGLVVFFSLRRLPGEAVRAGRDTLRELAGLAAAFNQQTVETSFLSYASRVEGSTFLQFATLDEVEVFERSDRTSTLWGTVPLPEVVVRATAPTQYTYYLDLGGAWDFEIEDHRVRVRSPAIAWNRPAIDATRIHYEVETGSLFRDEEAVLRELKAGMAAAAHRRAQENVALVREIGRRRTEQFIADWLLQSFAEPPRAWQVEVVFADEDPRRLEIDAGAPR